jgi:hypothetical protein
VSRLLKYYSLGARVCSAWVGNTLYFADISEISIKNIELVPMRKFPLGYAVGASEKDNRQLPRGR